jgi:FkbM family methyltransferase
LIKNIKALLRPIRKAKAVFNQPSHLGFIDRFGHSWRALTLQTDLLLGKDAIVRQVQGHKMLLNIQRPGISHELAIWGEREILETKIFKSVVKSGMVVVDLGANIGYYTLMASSLVKDHGKVYAIEPVPVNYSVLAKNVSLNRLENIVELHHIAISSRQGKSRFFLGEADNLGTLMDYIEHGKISEFIDVQTTTLDQFMESRGAVDLIRMDLEGSELDVFEGMQRTFKQKIPPRLFFEVHPVGPIDPDPRYTPYFQHLVSMGYLPKFVVSSGNSISASSFAELGYHPNEKLSNGQALYEDVDPQDLIKVGARRPKITRALYLVHGSDSR